jgi:hypothetical protein
MTDGPLLYLPRVLCAQCNRFVPVVQRIHEPHTNRRYVRAMCHGRAVDLPFVDEPWKEVVAFKDADAVSDAVPAQGA